MATAVAEKNDLFVLDETHVEAFYREGYFLARQLIDIDTVDEINSVYDARVQEFDGKEWCSMGFDQGAQGFLNTPRMTAMFEQILGGPTKLWLGMYAVVAPGGQGLEWHQDNMYTHVLGHMLNAFIALDHITQDNAGLWIAPQSHRLGRQENINEHEGHRRAATPSNGEPCPPLAPGDAVVFHRELLHHSKTNHSDAPRRAFAFQVSAANCRFAKTGKLVESKEAGGSY